MPICLSITCLCGTISRAVTARPSHDGQRPIPLTLCHCNTCRRTSGVLCTSYCPIEAPVEGAFSAGSLGAFLTAYASSPGTTRYFCRACGCHVFRSRQSSGDNNNKQTYIQWEVATGAIVDESNDKGDGDDDDPSFQAPVLEYVRHDHVADTGDGGLAVWLPAIAGRRMAGLQADIALGRQAEPSTVEKTSSSTTAVEIPGNPDDRTISATCHCGAVRFAVRPPDYNLNASRKPHSGFPDLLVPFAAADASTVANPEDVKWWLRPSKRPSSTTPTRYLAGTCACQSCRLATGFEIQTWVFVPRENIILPNGELFEFTTIDHHALATYRSSPGVERNFCNCCGATVFWHDIWRPDLIDVSAGLLLSEDSTGGINRNTSHGSRIESLLDWCTTRVSFAEEALRGRRGLSIQRGLGLVDSLETGMKAAGESSTN